jgi:hypothetical protein
MEHLHFDSIAGTPEELSGVREHRATYTPASVIALRSLPAADTSLLTGTNATVYIIRTWHFDSTAARTVTISFGADAAGTRLFDAYTLTASVPAIFNGWWTLTGSASANDIRGQSSATTVVMLAGGYTYA